MWQVQAGIAAVALPLLIVVIQFSRDVREAAARRPEVLIQDTGVFPIIVFALAGTARLGIDIAWFATESVFWVDFFLVFIATICLTVFAYSRMLLILLSPLRMKKSSMAVIRNKMNAQLDTTIERRVANAMLFRRLAEMGVEYWPFSLEPHEEERYVVLRSLVSGTLRDIHIGKLETFINRLPWKEPRPSSFEEPEIEIEKGRILREALPKRYIWWMKQYGSQINSQNDGLMRLDNSMFDISSHGSLEAQLGQLIKVVKEDGRDGLRLELSYLRDNLMDAIRDCKTGAVHDGLQMYEELVATFLDKLQQWGSTYRRDDAIRASTSLEGGWLEIRWITDDLQEIIDMAMGTEHISVMREVLHFPLRLALLAFSHKDYYIFHQFVNWVPYYYVTALSLTDTRTKEFVVGRCSMYLAETVRYPVIPSIERAMTDAEIEDGKQFAKGIILVFNRMLKSAYDEKKMEHFKAFSATVHSVFESFFRHNQDHEVVSLDLRLRDPSLTQAQRGRLERQLNLKRKHVSSAKELKETIDIMLYGLNAWLLHEYADDKVTADEFKQWDEIFAHPHSLKESWNAFCLAVGQEDKDDFEWSFWESKEQKPSPAFAGIVTFWGGFERHFQMTFCIQCLKLVGGMDEKQRESATIPHSREIVSLAENESSPLRQVLKQIEQGASKWTAIIGEESFKAIPAFERVLDKAVQAQKQEDAEFLKAAQVSVQRVGMVKREIVDAWKKNAMFRHIVQKYGDYEFVDKPPKGKGFFGFNQLQPKDIYVDNTGTVAEGWGSHFGRDLASGEDESFVEKVLNNVEELDKSVVDRDPVHVITEALDKSERANYKPVIVILNSWSAFAAVEKSGSFHKRENHFGQGLVGHFRNRPLFHLQYRGAPFIIVIDLKRFGVWRQFRPLRLFKEEEYISEELTFCVKPFTEKTAKDAVQQNPKLLLDRNGNQRPETKVISQLQLQVHFRLLEQYELEVRDKDSGYKAPTQL